MNWFNNFISDSTAFRFFIERERFSFIFWWEIAILDFCDFLLELDSRELLFESDFLLTDSLGILWAEP